MSPKNTLQIALPVPLPGCFDYVLHGTVAPPRGSRVKVPFGRRTLVGLVHGHAPSDYPKLKAVQAVLDDEPVMPDELYQLCERAAPASYTHLTRPTTNTRSNPCAPRA